MVFPNITGASSHYFLDTGMVLDQHSAPVILSDTAVVEMAKVFGFVSRGTAEEMQKACDEKDEEITVLQQRIEDLEKFKSAVKLISDEKKKAMANG
jgi:hypothetical protein